ncbi:MAG: porin [Alphaproteobacteria bacterium]
MKRVLLGSTALLGAAMIFATPAAAEMEVAFSGFLKAEFWGVDQDDKTDERDYVFGVDDSEFHIKAKNTADNGLHYGVTLEIEMADDLSMDEGYLWFRGDNWGTLQLGGNDGVSNDMPYSGDFSLTAAFGYDGGLGSVWNFQNSLHAPDLAADTGDAAKINYYSPRFSGIQVGITYLPDGDQDQIGSDTLSSPVGGEGSDEDVIQVGLNFVDTINGVDIGVGGAYSTSSHDGGPPGPDMPLEDTEGYHVGFNVGFSGFTFGASYGDNLDSGCSKATSSCDGGQFYEVAGGYGTGPWTVSAGWFHGEKDDGPGLSQETDIFSVGAKYSLAPGAVIIAELNMVDEDAADSADDNEGFTYMIGTQISF